MNNLEKLQEATIKALQETSFEQADNDHKKLLNNRKASFINKLINSLDNIGFECKCTHDDTYAATPKASNMNNIIKLEFDPWNLDYDSTSGILEYIVNCVVYDSNKPDQVSIKYYNKCFNIPLEKENIEDKYINKIISYVNSCIEKGMTYRENYLSSRSQSLKWKTMDIEDSPLILQCKKNGYWFNIWKSEEDNTYEVTINYVDSYGDDHELQDYDENNFQTIEDAKKYVQEIYLKDPGPSYED